MPSTSRWAAVRCLGPPRLRIEPPPPRQRQDQVFSAGPQTPHSMCTESARCDPHSATLSGNRQICPVVLPAGSTFFSGSIGLRIPHPCGRVLANLRATLVVSRSALRHHNGGQTSPRSWNTTLERDRAWCSVLRMLRHSFRGACGSALPRGTRDDSRWDSRERRRDAIRGGLPGKAGTHRAPRPQPPG